VLQQLERPSRGDVTVNDTLQAVSKYWDRITRPEQILSAALNAMRVLTDPAETGAVTLALPQDVQTEAFDVPDDFLARRVWHIERRPPEAAALARAIELINAARRPLIVAGGGVIYSGATGALRAFVDRSGIPVAETQAGKGALPYDHPLALGAIGATGTFAANRVARDADVVIGIGTRWSDFTTASKTLFEGASVRFIDLNVASVDAFKLNALPLLCDARAGLEGLAAAEWAIDERYRTKAEKLHVEWDAEVARLYALEGTPPAQSAVIGAVNEASGPRDVVVCAAGSMPGDLHKLWRTRDPKGYHVEYGYSTMGYEIPGGIGTKLAAPDREVSVLVGDLQHDARERLPRRDHRPAVAGGVLGAERPGERLPERQARGRDLGVGSPGRHLEREVEARLLGEEPEQVVEDGEPRRRARPSCGRERDADSGAGLLHGASVHPAVLRLATVGLPAHLCNGGPNGP